MLGSWGARGLAVEQIDPHDNVDAGFIDRTIVHRAAERECSAKEVTRDARSRLVKPRPPLPRQPPGELLFEFDREPGHTRWRCDLREHPEPDGVDAQFSATKHSITAALRPQMSRERTPREMAIAWAEAWRKDLEKGET